MLICVAGVAGVVALAWMVTREEPRALQQIEQAQTAGERAGERAEAILANLNDIADNLEAGAGLSQQSAAIRQLTQRQRQSLRALTDVLRDQIAALERSVGSIEGTERATIQVADLSARQAAAIRRSVRALERLRRAAATSGAMSADFAVKAAYAARLAEDSSESFADE